MKKRTQSRRQTQLDRIERKLDDLLSRPAMLTPPGQWSYTRTIPSPATPKPEPDYPHDIYGNPVPYAASFGGTK